MLVFVGGVILLASLILGRPHPLQPLHGLAAGRPHSHQVGVAAPSGQLDSAQSAVAPVVSLDFEVYQEPRNLALVRAQVERGYALLAVESIVESHFLHDNE